MLILETMRSVAKNGLVGYGILRGDISCDSFLGSGLSGCSPQGISLTEKDSYSGTGNCIPMALICEQTAVVLRVRSEWHSE